jgi:hypothetical protein
MAQLREGAFGAEQVLHFDPFAFVMAQDAASTRSMYRDIVRECDARIERGELAVASVFITWGSNGAAAMEDLYGAGCLGGVPEGYQALISSVSPEQRVVVKWCWELFFSLLLIVPKHVKAPLGCAIKTDVAWLKPLMRRFEVVV